MAPEQLPKAHDKPTITRPESRHPEQIVRGPLPVFGVGSQPVIFAGMQMLLPEGQQILELGRWGEQPAEVAQRLPSIGNLFGDLIPVLNLAWCGCLATAARAV